jgi:hypothetical protein
VFLLKLIRVLAVVFFVWLVWYLLYSMVRKAVFRQSMRNAADKTRRKYVKSSVVEEETERGDGEES